MFFSRILPLDACRAFGWTLQHEADDAISANPRGAQPGPRGRAGSTGRAAAGKVIDTK